MSIRCKLGFHKWEEIWYGYPANEKKWQSGYVCKRCKARKTEIDDWYFELRPTKYYPISRNIIRYVQSARKEQLQLLYKHFENSEKPKYTELQIGQTMYISCNSKGHPVKDRNEVIIRHINLKDNLCTVEFKDKKQLVCYRKSLYENK